MPIYRDALRLQALRVVGRLLSPRRPAVGRPRRILLIRPDHLGDVLLSGPAVAALRASLPDAHLALMVGPWSLELARRGPTVDEFRSCPFPGFTRQRKADLLAPYRLLLRQARDLRGRFDLAVVLRPDHWWGALLAAVAGIPLRLGYALPTTSPLLTEALPLAPATHVGRLSLALTRSAAELAGGDLSPFGSPAGPSFRLTDDERAWADRLVAGGTEPLVLLHPGSGAPVKNWPAERWALVADALAERGVRIVLTGGADDPDGPAAVAAAMRRQPLDLAGRTSLGQLAALAARAHLAIGGDSGPLHLAAALGTPTLRLYGPTDPSLFGPWDTSPSHRVLTTPLACRPCGSLVRPPCGAVAQPACLLGLQVEPVLSAALELLAQSENGTPLESG